MLTELFLKRFVNLVLNIFAFPTNSKFHFVRAEISKIHSQTCSYYKNKFQRKPKC